MTFRVDIENAVQMYFSKILVIDRLTPKHICDCAELLACMKRIPIIQIRWSWDPLIFVMPIPIPIKTVLLSYLDQLYYIAWQRRDIDGDGNGQHIALRLQGALALQDNWTLSVTPDILHHTANVLVAAEKTTAEGCGKINETKGLLWASVIDLSASESVSQSFRCCTDELCLNPYLRMAIKPEYCRKTGCIPFVLLSLCRQHISNHDIDYAG